MGKRVIAVMMTIAMLLGCVCDLSVVSAAESNSERYYLRSDYAVSTEGVTSDEAKTDGSTGDPQIDVNSGTSAKIVVKADRLSEMSAATITYAQSGGTLDVKLTALTSADAADGVELCHNALQAADGYATRTSEPVTFHTDVPADAKFLRVELAVNGSLDGKSYVNYIEVSKKVTVKPVVQWKSVANGKALDITGSGVDNGNIVTASEASGAKSQTWTIQEGDEKGWCYLINENSNKGMGLLGGTTAPGAEPVQWTTDGSSNQFWRFIEVKKDNRTYYKILNKNSKLALTVNDSKVTQEAYTGADNQLFEAVMVQGTTEFGSRYDDNYSIGNISVSAENYVISYGAMYSMQNGMYFELALSDGQTSTEGKGTFKVSGDGEYTLTASLYKDDTKTVKVCEDYVKKITLTDGAYKIIGAEWTSSTEQSPWTDNGAVDVRDVTDEQVEDIKNSAADYIVVDQNIRYQAMDSNPWGGCFNEKGWYAMRDLTDEERESVIQALFDPNTDGLKLTAGRTPIGSSDFGLDMYTYADGEWDDYDMSSFTIERDKQHLIPFIKAAMKYVPDMPIFSSPWTPPAWMKTNNKLNGVEAGWPGIEDTPENFEAYATYFVKYLEAYAAEGIDLYAVTPQNEPTMNTPYPSCVWNGNQLNVFLRDYLCDAVEGYNKANNKNVEVWLGTFTDSNQSMVWPTYKDPVTSTKVDGYCFQWWGAPLATKLYAQSKAENGTPVKMIQSESKCGGGDNSWQYAEEQFDCYKEFLDAGVSQYHLWNMILEGNGENNAEPAGRRWPQNAPISVNGKNIRYNPSFYQVKHFSSNIDAGARRIKVEGNNLGEGSVSGYVQDLRAIGFQNTDGEVVLNVKNSTSAAKEVTVVVNNEAFDVTVPAHSINTFKLDGTYENTPDATEVTAIEETTNLKFTSAATGDLLSAEGFSNGDVINTASNRGESNQTWKLVKSDKEGYYHLINFATDLGVAVWDGLTTEGAEIKQFQNSGTDDQKWALEFVEYRGAGANRKAYYKIVNYKSGLVLTALGESNNKALTQKKYTGADDQLWTLDIVGGEWTFPDDNEPEKQPASISVTPPTKVEYISGEELDTKGMKITVTYTDGTTAEVTAADCVISGYDKEKVGQQTVTVSYAGKTADFHITVKEKQSSEPKEADKTALKKAIDTKVNAEDTYTAESWKAYADALTAANTVYNKKDASQAEVDAAAKALTDAQTALKEKPKRPFVDVNRETGDWYYDAVYYNFDRGIMNGINETHFAPLDNLARAQFAIILYNMEGKPGAAYEPKFKDVEDKQWYTEAIMWASSKEIVTGYTDGSETFGWGDNILREQMAVMMYRYAKNFKDYDVSDSADFDKFEDAASVSGYAEEAMKWAVGSGIITGKYEGTKIDPQGYASRAECAIIIQRFLDKYEK